MLLQINYVVGSKTYGWFFVYIYINNVFMSKLFYNL